MRGTRPLTADGMTSSVDPPAHALDRALLALAANTRTRSSEAFSVSAGDVRGKAQLYLARTNTKGRRTGRVVPLNPTVRAELDGCLATRPRDEDSEALFPSRRVGWPCPASKR